MSLEINMKQINGDFIKNAFSYMVSFFQRAFDYKGTATKLEFAIPFMVYLLLFTGIGLVFLFFSPTFLEQFGGCFHYCLFCLFTFQIPAIALSVRRFNDINNKKEKKIAVSLLLSAILIVSLLRIFYGANILLNVFYDYYYVPCFVLGFYVLINLIVFYMGLKPSNHENNPYYEYEKQRLLEIKEKETKSIKQNALIDFFTRAFDYKGITTKREFFTSFIFYYWLLFFIAIVMYIINVDKFIGIIEYHSLDKLSISQLQFFDKYYWNYWKSCIEVGWYLKIISLFIIIPTISLIYRRFNDMNTKCGYDFTNFYTTIIFAILAIITGYCIDSFEYLPSVISGAVLVLYCSLLPSEKRKNLLNQNTLVILSLVVYGIWWNVMTLGGGRNLETTCLMPLIMIGIICALCSGHSDYINNPCYEYEKERLEKLKQQQEELEKELEMGEKEAVKYDESVKTSVGLDNLEKAAKLYKQKLITKAEFEKIKKQCLSE